MIETLISSKTRIKLLLKFFLNSSTRGYLRGLEQEFGESSNSIRIELNRLEKAGMLLSNTDGNKKFFSANIGHPLYNEVHNILMKYIGIDTVINKVVNKLGSVESVYLVGSLSKGIDCQIIDLVFVGDVDTNYLVNLIAKVEKLISRKLRYIIYKEEIEHVMNLHPGALLLWTKDDIHE